MMYRLIQKLNDFVSMFFNKETVRLTMDEYHDERKEYLRKHVEEISKRFQLYDEQATKKDVEKCNK